MCDLTNMNLLLWLWAADKVDAWEERQERELELLRRQQLTPSQLAAEDAKSKAEEEAQLRRDWIETWIWLAVIGFISAIVFVVCLFQLVTQTAQ
jgi:hypothetical protein